MEKEFYKLRPSDFIPIVGMINHIERYYEGGEQSELDKRYFIRGIALTAYNFAFMTGLGGLASLLAK